MKQVCTSEVNVRLLFIAELSAVETAGAVEKERERERESKTAGPGQGGMSGEQVWVP